MRNFLCWKPGAVRQVINPFAEHITDALFRAVHTDWDLKVSPPVGKTFQDLTEAVWVSQTPAEFLANFLRSDLPHTLAVVLGETGSGKSHLVHWMRLNIKTDSERVVLVVRKSGTSLRNIVRMIIDELPLADRRPFLETLEAAGDATQSRADQKQQLLNDIAQAIREDTLASDAEEIERELVNRLPDVFQDPHMRVTHFLADNSVVADIVDHIFAQSSAKHRPETRREFSEADLPLGGRDFANASKQARDAMQLIECDPEYLPLAVKIINRNLNRAVARTLSFSGDRLEELMTRLRSHLKSNGRELVLLIEEFARLQGIDRPLLQAITTQGDDRLCKMRSMIAVTKGFFGSVAETAYMRTTHIVDMDRSAGHEGEASVTEHSLNRFAARYLNAVRLGDDKIEAWSKKAAPGEAPPSACEGCKHEHTCHAAFGAVDGFGLYPFTSTSLWNAARRADATLPASLNPRVLQNDLLAEILDNQGEAIGSGQFPTYKLLERLGGVRQLSLPAQAQLRSRNPQLFERWAAFLELYDGTGEVRNLDQAVREALGVPEIPDAPAAAAMLAPTQVKRPGPTPEAPALSREDIAIQEWINAGSIDQVLMSQLRPLLFSAIVEAIDWDMLCLERSSFAGQTRPFRPTSISFDRQLTQVQHAQIKVQVPGALVAPVVGFGLQGLLRASKNGFQWDFDGGDAALAAFLDCLSAWVQSVEEQLRALVAPSPQWCDGEAALHLLCVAGAIGGRIRSEASPGDMLDGAFSSLPSECQSTSTEMVNLYGLLFRHRDKLVTAARSQLSSMKGGRVGAMLDPVRVKASVKKLRQLKWALEMTPSADDRSDVAKIYRQAALDLETASAAEVQVRLGWLQRVEHAFGADATRAGITEGLDRITRAVLDAGIKSGNTARALSVAVETLKGAQLDDSIAAARALSKVDTPRAALAQLGRGRRNAVEAAEAVIVRANEFLTSVEQNIEEYIEDAGSPAQDLAKSVDEINRALEMMDDDLSALVSEGGQNAA